MLDRLRWTASGEIVRRLEIDPELGCGVERLYPVLRDHDRASHSPLVIHPDGVKPLEVTPQCFEPIAGRRPEVKYRRGCIKHVQLPCKH